MWHVTRCVGRIACRQATGQSAWLLVAIAALLLQSTVVQTHVREISTAASEHVAVHASPGARHGADQPGDCPLCREVAQAGAYLTPALPALEAPVAVHILPVTVPIMAIVLVAFAPAWRSRAPPLR